MSDPKLVVEHPDGLPPGYIYQRRVVKLRGGIEVQLEFVARRGRLPSAPLEYEVRESPRLIVPLEGQILAARAMVQLLGKLPEEAAKLAADLKVQAEGLTLEQAEEVFRDIISALDSEE
jgi:hypothetical protein